MTKSDARQNHIKWMATFQREGAMFRITNVGFGSYQTIIQQLYILENKLVNLGVFVVNLGAVEYTLKYLILCLPLLD